VALAFYLTDKLLNIHRKHDTEKKITIFELCIQSTELGFHTINNGTT